MQFFQVITFSLFRNQLVYSKFNRIIGNDQSRFLQKSFSPESFSKQTGSLGYPTFPHQQNRKEKSKGFFIKQK